MEPAAPGTEDEIKPISPSALTKKENEQERLLSIKTRLRNGKIGSVFELSFQNGSEHWYCNLCECPIMGRVYYHEIGKRHTNNMQSASNSNYVSFEADPSLQIAPGEPIPPGFEGEFEKVAQIQERLDGFTVGPLIGLEYLFELTEYAGDKEPFYLCLLCDKRGDPRTVIAHLASYNHITQYAQRHFVSCYRALSPYITKQYKRNWQATVQKIAEAIENKFGRLKPHVVDKEVFKAKREYYQNLVACGPHFRERSGVTFEELIDREQLTKPVEDDVTTISKPSEDFSKRSYRKTGTEITSDEKKSKRSPSPPVVIKPKKPKTSAAASERRRSLSSVSSISSSDLSDFDPAQHPPGKKEVVHKLADVERRRRSPFRRHGRRSRSRSKSYSPTSKRRLLPWQRSDYIRSRVETSTDNAKQKNDKVEEYKKLATAIENDMDRTLKQHEKNPEKHPQYNEEWRTFWNKRYKELQGEGKDPQTHDFKPEWIVFWNKKMNELHSVEVKNRKDALRKRLGLAEEPAPISFKIGGKRKPSSKDDKDSTKHTPMAATPDQDPDVIVIEDKEEDASSKRSHSPWENESSSYTIVRPREKSKEKSRPRSRDRSRDRIRERGRKSLERDRSRSRSRNREKVWQSREYSREKYYREPYRKSDLPDYIKPPRVLRDATRHPVLSPSDMHRIPDDILEPEDDGDINIVGVLRLLTALEEKLGSLGPKVIDLLGQALAMEKSQANSSESLLDNEVNCVLFETVKEKLKGQLLAGLVGYTQEKAFKNAIKKIASLIHFAGERKKQKEKEKPKIDPIKVPGVGTVDKAAIAKQIATALVLQGKTDVSQSELEQLINAVVGMAEASRASNKPVTTATFVQQLAKSKADENKIDLCSNSSKSSEPSTSHMEGLSDSDLQTLLQNFKDLSTDEQHSLISYLKKLEAKEPERVERLRKFVNLDSGSGNTSQMEKNTEKEDISGRNSPFANRAAGVNPTVEENADKTIDDEHDRTDKTVKISLDSDDEDYSYEDVFKAAKQNVKEKEEKEEKERNTTKSMMFKTEDFDLSNAKSLIANIMGQFKINNSEPSSASNLLGLGVGNAQKSETAIAPSLLKGLDSFPINLTGLADAIQTAQKAKANENANVQNNQMNVSQQNPHADYYPNQPEPSRGMPQLLRPQNVPPGNIGNRLPTAYPQQNPFGNPNPHMGGQQHFDRSGYEQNRFNPQYNPNNHNVNMFNSRPRPDSYDNYGNRW